MSSHKQHSANIKAKEPKPSLATDLFADNGSKLQGIISASQLGLFEWACHTGVFVCDTRMCELIGLDGTLPITTLLFLKRVAEDDKSRVATFFDGLSQQPIGETATICFKVEFFGAAHVRWIELSGRAIDNGARFVGTARDISSSINYVTSIEGNDHLYRQLFDNVNANFALHEIIMDTNGKAVDYRFLVVNQAMERAVGIKAADLVGKTAKQIFPRAEQHWIDRFAEVAQTGLSMQYEDYSSELGRYYEVKLFSPFKGQFAMLATDITEQTLAKHQQQEMKEHFEQLFNLYPDSVTITRLSDGLVVDVNNGYCVLTGYSRHEVIGKTSLDINLWVDPSQRQMFLELLQQNGSCIEFVADFCCKDGRIIHGEVSAVLVYTYDAPHILSVTRDITRRMQAEDDLRENERALLQSQQVAGLGTYKLDFATGTWVSSPIMDDIFGIDSSCVRDIAFWRDMIHPDWVEKMADYLTVNVLQKHEKFDKEYMIVRKSNQQPVWIHGMGELIFDDNHQLRYMVGTIQDITRRKEAELIIQQQNKELRELNATKNKLFSIIAHDLRNPFQVLLSFSEFLMVSAKEFDRRNILKMASQINIVSMETFVLLENLLDWSQIQTGRLMSRSNTYNLKEIIDEVLILARELARSKEIVVTNKVIESHHVFCDKDMTKTVLRNLVFNAIKFTPEAGKISVTVFENNPFVTVMVNDSGIGIAAESIAKLFSVESFTTKGTANEHGSGLGLHICKELVEKQGGRIWVESQPDVGSTFYFTLPVGR